MMLMHWLKGKTGLGGEKNKLELNVSYKLLQTLYVFGVWSIVLMFWVISMKYPSEKHQNYDSNKTTLLLYDTFSEIIADPLIYITDQFYYQFMNTNELAAQDLSLKSTEYSNVTEQKLY